MGWKLSLPMDEKKEFIEAWLSREFTFCDLCEEFGVTHKTGPRQERQHGSPECQLVHYTFRKFTFKNHACNGVRTTLLLVTVTLHGKRSGAVPLNP